MSPSPSSSPPTVGRVVHYAAQGEEGSTLCRPALVTEVPDQPEEFDGVHPVHLAIFHPIGLSFDLYVTFSEDSLTAETWHWPCVRTEN